MLIELNTGLGLNVSLYAAWTEAKLIVMDGISCFAILLSSDDAFGALTLLVWHQEEYLAVKTGLMRCWHCYLSGARCRWCAYGPADATASHHLLLDQNPDWFNLSAASL